MSQPDSHEIQVRVRYAETDRMGLLHHATYAVYFEMGRTELLRSRGHSYREVEDAGFFLSSSTWSASSASPPATTTC